MGKTTCKRFEKTKNIGEIGTHTSTLKKLKLEIVDDVLRGWYMQENYGGF